jgi:hypothetical protein
VRTVDLDRRPRLQARRVAAEATGAVDRGQHASRAGQELTPAGIEVVAVVVVREKHNVDRLDRLHVHSGASGLDEAALILARGRQRGIRQPSQPCVIQNGGWSSDELSG